MAGRNRFSAPFDPRGRLSVRSYRRVIVRAFLAASCLLCMAIWLSAAEFRGGAILTFAGNVGVALHVLAATARRLHDRDRSPGWLIAIGVVYGASLAPIEDASERHPLAVVAAVAAILGFSAWFFVETMLRAGIPGANRFGPAPGP